MSNLCSECQKAAALLATTKPTTWRELVLRDYINRAAQLCHRQTQRRRARNLRRAIDRINTKHGAGAVRLGAAADAGAVGVGVGQ